MDRVTFGRPFGDQKRKGVYLAYLSTPETQGPIIGAVRSTEDGQWIASRKGRDLGTFELRSQAGEKLRKRYERLEARP